MEGPQDWCSWKRVPFSVECFPYWDTIEIYCILITNANIAFVFQETLQIWQKGKWEQNERLRLSSQRLISSKKYTWLAFLCAIVGATRGIWNSKSSSIHGWHQWLDSANVRSLRCLGIPELFWFCCHVDSWWNQLITVLMLSSDSHSSQHTGCLANSRNLWMSSNTS